MASSADPVLTEIVRNGLIAITEEMKSNLMRSAYSMIIYEAQDFTVGLFDAEGNTVSIGIGLPMFTRGMSDVVKAMIAHFGRDGLCADDVLITNDAYLTGSHLNHVTLVVPIFADGDLVGFSACMAHWQDIGGALNIATRDIFSEGLQIPILKLQRAGTRNEDVYAIVNMNVRIPERAMGDLNAQTAAVQTGARRYRALVSRYGRDSVLGAIGKIMDGSEAVARQSVLAIPDGEYFAESFMDDDGIEAGQRVPIRVRVVVRGDEMTVDLSNIALQVKGFFNSGEAAGRACCEVAFKCLTSAAELPINDGTFRPLKVILPKGTVVSAVKPAAMLKWMTYPMTVIDTIIKALAPAIPERVAAAHHADLMTVMVNGRMPDDGRLFILLGGMPGGGWGAKSGSDGMSATICINDGDTHNSPIEQLEAKYPVRVERYALRCDSGGAGTWQGGLGTEKCFLALSEFNINAQIERVFCRPWGLFGGHPGAGNQVALKCGGEPELRLPSGKVYGRALKPGDAYILRSGGGGGYGSPLERSLEAIESDLREGYISPERAEGCYGVVVDRNSGAIDQRATAEKRRDLSHRAPLMAERETEDGDSAGNDEGVYLSQAGLFPLRCC